jgi:hypothetical protein
MDVQVKKELRLRAGPFVRRDGVRTNKPRA